jgi:hypothetical protein
MKCSVTGCDRPIKARGFCSGHYQRWQAGGDLIAPLRSRTNRGDPCKREGCKRSALKMGLCEYHYDEVENSRNPCMQDGCDEPQVRRYRCEFHYHVWYLSYGKSILDNKCRRHDCQRPAGQRTELCRVHYKQAWLYGLSTNEYLRLWSDPQCSNPACGERNGLHIDHDHSCCPNILDRNKGCGDCVRGLLCGGCNKALGLLGDDPAKLLGLADYLNTYARS